jgi:hypothetical protein
MDGGWHVLTLPLRTCVPLPRGWRRRPHACPPFVVGHHARPPVEIDAAWSDPHASYIGWPGAASRTPRAAETFHLGHSAQRLESTVSFPVSCGAGLFPRRRLAALRWHRSCCRRRVSRPPGAPASWCCRCQLRMTVSVVWAETTGTSRALPRPLGPISRPYQFSAGTGDLH